MKTYCACFVSIACYVMKVNGLKTEIIAQKIHVSMFHIASIQFVRCYTSCIIHSLKKIDKEITIMRGV